MDKGLLNSVIAGVLQGPPKRFLHLSEEAPDDLFPGEYRIVWKIVARVYEVSRALVDDATFSKLLPAAKLPVETMVQVEQLWRAIRAINVVSDADFYTSVELVKEDYRRDMLGKALVDTADILRSGVKDERGAVAYGPDDAVAHLREKLASLESLGSEPIPDFSLREDRDSLMQALVGEDALHRVATGIRGLDSMTGGGHGAGEFWLPFAGTGVGKSMFCVNIAWYRYIHGDNVVYFTTETLYKQIKWRLFVRHLQLPQFRDIGVNSSILKSHTAERPILTPQQWDVVMAAYDDFHNNPQYGEMAICQIPDRTKMSHVEARLYRRREEWGSVDYCVIDSLDMLSSEVRRQDERAELNEVVNKAKALAIGFDAPNGLRVLAPWQANRSGHEEAVANGRYKINALGDTHMAAKRADLIVGLLENREIPTLLRAQTLKFRDAAALDFELEIDYDRCLMAGKASAAESLADSHSDMNDLA